MANPHVMPSHGAQQKVPVAFFAGVVAGFLVWGQCFWEPTAAYAQRFAEGDKVEVLFMHEWRPGTVVQVDQRGNVLVEFEWAFGAERRVFAKTEVRWAYEVGALCRPRTWTDTTGKFKTRAVLLAVSEDRVTLRKPDMTELELPLSKLSDEDQQFVKRLQKEKDGGSATTMGTQVPLLPPVEQFDTGSDSGSFAAFGNTTPQRAALEPDLLPDYLALTQGGVGFPLEGFHDSIGAVVPVGGADSEVLAAVESRSPLNPSPTRLLWAALKDQKIKGRQMLAPGEVVLDYHAPSHRLLTLSMTGNPLTAPGTASPGTTLPGMTEPETTVPGTTEPETTVPGRRGLGRARPEMSLPGMSLPGMEAQGPTFTGPILIGTSVLTLWEVTAADRVAKPIVRWQSSSGSDTPTGPLTEPWARLVDGETVVHRWASHELVAWSITDKRMKYRITQESRMAPPPVISAGRKYLVIPEDTHVRILDSATGEPKSLLPMDDGTSGVAISDDGRRLAVLGRSTLSVWDLTSATADPLRCQAAGIGSPFAASLNWVDDEHLIVDRARTSFVLYSLKHEMAVWNYQLGREAAFDGLGRRTRDIVNGHLVYAASTRAGVQSSQVVGAVTLPGPKVAEATATFDTDALLALKAGASIRLDVRAGNDTARVQQVLAGKIAANGWRLDPNAPIVMVAEMGRGTSEKVTYRSTDAGFRRDREQEVTVTPHVSGVRIEVNRQVAWQAGTSTGGPPPVIMLKQGQTAQGEVDRWQYPNVEFFDALVIPPRILDPKWRDGLGVTDIGVGGLVPR